MAFGLTLSTRFDPETQQHLFVFGDADGRPVFEAASMDEACRKCDAIGRGESVTFEAEPKGST